MTFTPPAPILYIPALFALNFCSLRFTAPLSIEHPGINKTPARKLPIREPSTKELLPLIKATLYKIISMMEPNVALITAPRPILDCAEMELTAIPIKYDRGMTEPRPSMNTKEALVNQAFGNRSWRTFSSKITKKATGSKLMKMMLIPS